jgi:hypothetical protein
MKCSMRICHQMKSDYLLERFLDKKTSHNVGLNYFVARIVIAILSSAFPLLYDSSSVCFQAPTEILLDCN